MEKYELHSEHLPVELHSNTPKVEKAEQRAASSAERQRLGLTLSLRKRQHCISAQ